MDVSSHQHTVVCRHSEKGDEADPYGYAQVRIWNRSRILTPASEKFMNQS